jgi:DNA-binding response OmpR family regulator
MPDIIIADLMMPKMDGAEFIKRIRADNRWRGLPVIVLTNSRDERDVAEAWDIGASAVIVKPVNAREMANVVKTLRDFYLSVVRLPNRG